MFLTHLSSERVVFPNEEGAFELAEFSFTDEFAVGGSPSAGSGSLPLQLPLPSFSAAKCQPGPSFVARSVAGHKPEHWQPSGFFGRGPRGKRKVDVATCKVTLIRVRGWNRRGGKMTPAYSEIRQEYIQIEEESASVPVIVSRMRKAFNDDSLELCTANFLPINESEATQSTALQQNTERVDNVRILIPRTGFLENWQSEVFRRSKV